MHVHLFAGPVRAVFAAPLAGILLAGAPAPPHRQTSPGHPRPTLTQRADARPSRDDTLRAVHLLARATYGVRREDLDAVLRSGRAAWLERQLHPERIRDDALETRLAAFPAAAMSPGELIAAYPAAQAARRASTADSMAAPARQRAACRQMAQPTTSGDAQPCMPRQRRGQPRPAQILAQLAGARLQRSVYSERQLEAVMTEFWFDHFNVFFGKNQDRYLVGDYERSAIRPHVFGHFRELLGATAHHPAMLVYLDNVRSSVPLEDGEAMAAPPAAAGRQRPRGLNENYARELMELHTLGVEGGYTQHDVVEVARALTGWSVDRPRGGDPRFLFRPRLHDPGEKTILGRRFPAGHGEDEGEAVLDLLARSPATAHHLSLQLARRFIADDPPPALVQRLEQTWLRSDGDLREVTRVLFSSPELDDPRYAGAKVKTPVEFVASALRATGASAGPSRGVIQTLRAMGHLPYFASAPTGYSGSAETWANSGAMLARMNFALALAAGTVDGVALTEGVVPEQADVAGLAATVLPGGVEAGLLATIERDLDAHAELAGPQRSARALGLLLGSPAFQRH